MKNNGHIYENCTGAVEKTILKYNCHVANETNETHICCPAAADSDITLGPFHSKPPQYLHNLHKSCSKYCRHSYSKITDYFINQFEILSFCSEKCLKYRTFINGPQTPLVYFLHPAIPLETKDSSPMFVLHFICLIIFKDHLANLAHQRAKNWL